MDVCRLCREQRELLVSHLMPAALYRNMRSPDAENPNPIVLTKDASFPTSKQVQTRLLCAGCEDRLNKNGERWVLAHYAKEDGSFPLREILRKYPPIWPDKPIKVFAASQIQVIEMNKLVYFAASVFWRASIHQWRFASDIFHTELGTEYTEEFRLFLLGKADFPQNAVLLVSVSAQDKPLNTVGFPHGGRQETFHKHRFVIPGIVFDLLLGSRLPPKFRRFCTVRSPENLIYMAEEMDQHVLQSMVDAFGRVR